MVSHMALSAIYLAGLLFAEGLQIPRRLARSPSDEGWRKPGGHQRVGELVVLVAIIAGMWILPAVYVFTRWLSAFDYAVPAWAVPPAIAVFVLGLFLRWRAQVDLGTAWSPTVELADRHHLVSEGVYARIRHPLYASLILWGAAQPVLLQNLIAGWAGPLAVVLIWLIRVPAEEKMMLQRFGEEYERYVERTGRAIPRPK